MQMSWKFTRLLGYLATVMLTFHVKIFVENTAEMVILEKLHPQAEVLHPRVY